MSLRRIPSAFALGIVLLALLLAEPPAARPTPLGIRPGNDLDVEAERFFDGPMVQFDIRLTPEAEQRLRESPREYVRAEIGVDGRVYTDVGIHVKGARGSLRDIGGKPALTLNFDKFVDGQAFRGLDKIHLNNSVQDPSYLNEALGSGLYRRAGLPTARATHARVRINGRERGLYVVKEGYDALFVKRHFPSGRGKRGNLYDGGFLQDVTDELEKDAGDGPDDRSDLRRLAEAAEAPLGERQQRLEQVLDIDRFLTFVAGQILTDDWDGYPRKSNNYRLYIPAEGQAVFIPHGMDQLFRQPQSTIDPGWQGLVAASSFELPLLRERLRHRLGKMVAQHFSPTVVSNQLERVVARLRKGYEGRQPAEWAALEQQIRFQEQRILRRIRSVERQLHGSIANPDATPVSLGALNWGQRHQRGEARLEITGASPLRRTLHLEALTPETMASFRAVVALEPGMYSVLGDARVEGVDGPIGAALRVSGRPRARGLLGTREWTRLRCDFEVEDEGQVEIVVELAADRGQAWFDLGSLRIQPR
jgi:spore coat protein H